jgi:hypothetical protein
LEHHIATVEDYIRRYRTIDDDAARTTLFHTFSQYLLASCWRKMRQRVNHWSTKGFIYLLGSLDEEHMRRLFDPSLAKPTSRKDSASAMILREPSLLASVYREYRRPHGSWAGKHTGFTHLPSAFGMGKSANPGPAYNTLTCFEFHQLLIGTLLGYKKTLNAFAQVISSDSSFG